MENPTQHRPGKKRPLIARLDAAAQDLNAVLLVLAIGLAVLDFTCFFAFEVRNAMPPRIPPATSVENPATAAVPPVTGASAGHRQHVSGAPQPQVDRAGPPGVGARRGRAADAAGCHGATDSPTCP